MQQRVNRERFGCDADSDRALLSITCPRCGGKRGPCDRCGGSGYEQLRRCPAYYQTPDVVQAARAWAWSDKALPVPGGYLDQSASWLSFTAHLDGERAAIMAEQRKTNEAKARAKRNAKGKAR